MTNCTEKFLKTTQRIGMRLNEFDATRAANPWEPDEKNYSQNINVKLELIY
jgi:hypothetical protein